MSVVKSQLEKISCLKEGEKMNIVTSNNKKLLKLLEELGIRTDKTYEVNIKIKEGEAVTVETKSYLNEENLRDLRVITKNYRIVEK